MIADERIKEILDTADAHIEWVLANRQTSDWLKQALVSALDREPVAVLNDLEMLRVLLGRRCRCLIELSIDPTTS